MRTCLAILVIAAAAGCAKDPAESKTEPFFVDWLKSHGETDVIVDEQGVGIAGNATRLKASLYGSDRQDDGSYVVETEFRVRLPSGGEIVEFVVGGGETEDQAISDCLLNFTLTTFHVLYKAFINPADPHQTVQPVEIAGRKREMLMGDIYMKGSESAEPIDLNAMRPGIQGAVAGLPLSQEPHWIKIVYGHVDGQPPFVSAALDNEEHQALTSAIERLDWPAPEGFYMVKLFIVVK
jgi:hypothetical protein